ncbi:MAG: helix-turn-helix transcriptional regulator [Rhizobiaceae bacterium]|nr:helix-turn-helix transcriptional regulator [Rhizobiaceae bacterium]
MTFLDPKACSILASAGFSLTQPDFADAAEFAITDPASKVDYTCRALCMEADRYGDMRYAAMVGRQDRSLVLTMTPVSVRRDAASCLASRYGLTPCEVRTALAVVKGQNTAEVAGERGLSVHTVRNQLKSALSKLGVRRQADLVRVIMRLGSGAHTVR